MSDAGEKKRERSSIALLPRKVLNGAIITGTAIVVISTFLQVVFRYFFNYSLAWTDETARYAFVWITFLGAAVALKEHKHVAVNYFESKFLSIKYRYILHIVRLIVIIWFLVLMIKYGVSLAVKVYPDLSPAMEITMTIPYLGVPAGGCAILYYVLRNLWTTIKMLIKGDIRASFLDEFEGGDL
jgi:C4-dicarboxylate transporter DctQ subunit